MSSSKKGGPLRRLVRPRLYQQLADHISDFIEAQGLAPGDRLPPERELAMELGVTRATLAQALVALEVAGRVEVRHGDGAVVQEARGSARLDAVVAHYPLSQLTAARAALLRGVVADSPEAAGSLRLGDETDSTVFWNYIDLRFAAARPMRIGARLTATELIVRLDALP